MDSNMRIAVQKTIQVSISTFKVDGAKLVVGFWVTPQPQVRYLMHPVFVAVTRASIS